MQTTLEIDDKLLHQAMQDSGATTERGVVEAALRLLIQTRAQAGMRELFGKVEWEGDLDEMRRSRTPDEPYS